MRAPEMEPRHHRAAQLSRCLWPTTIRLASTFRAYLVISSIAALTNTGPLAGAIPLTPTFQGSAGMAGAPWEGWAGLPGLTKAVLAAAMIVGRLETLAILALFSPEYWRR